MTSNPYQVLGLSEEATSAEIKAAYRTLARKFHPDANGGNPVAEEAFKSIKEAHEVLSDPDKRTRYDSTGSADPIVIQSRKAKYELERLAFSGDLADIYRGTNLDTKEDVAVKVVRDSANNDLIGNEWETLKTVRPTDAEDTKHNRYFPRPIESFRTDDGTSRRQINVLSWLDNWWPFNQVRDAFHGQLRMEHGVWMFNRILGALGYIHNEKKIIHGAVVPSHVLAYSSGKEDDPMNHGVKLVDWCYAVPMGKRIQAIVPEYEGFYPPEVLAKKPATTGTDIYMAAKCIIYVLGGNPRINQLPSHVPGYLSAFLQGCVLNNPDMRPDNAWVLHAELREHMRTHFGPRKYVRFDMPIRA